MSKISGVQAVIALGLDPDLPASGFLVLRNKGGHGLRINQQLLDGPQW